ncbi:class I SAM-dependent methyltransferase [Promineifilum sp.]|uniref:class I SAM-dependent methyltransferase n=1 Tax=Promineifilum sp. TaxID=2664178 RepID=UPI0035AE36A4
MSDPTPICDYEGSDYRARFWQNQGRDYEDQVERVALRRLMPPAGATLLDIGAGFGRLADEYGGYERVVLFDYSRSLLREAQAHLRDDPRFTYVAGNWYHMPFADGLFATLVQVRTLHHAADAPALFRELARVARPDAAYILEFASKHNLKAMLRYWLRRQAWSPFDERPVEFVELNFDFHPRWIREQLALAGFAPEEMLTTSHFRFAPLKRITPTSLLVAADSAIQRTGARWQLTPSVFVRSRLARPTALPLPGAFFACPTCHLTLGQPVDGLLVCANPACGRRWRVEDGLYDFKEPV